METPLPPFVSRRPRARESIEAAAELAAEMGDAAKRSSLGGAWPASVARAATASAFRRRGAPTTPFDADYEEPTASPERVSEARSPYETAE